MSWEYESAVLQPHTCRSSVCGQIQHAGYTPLRVVTAILEPSAHSAGDQSRNRTVGLRLGKGEKLEDIIKSTNTVAEGVLTSRCCQLTAHAIDGSTLSGDTDCGIKLQRP